MSDIKASELHKQVGSKTVAIPIAPSMEPSLLDAQIAKPSQLVDSRVVWITVLSIALAFVAGGIAQALTHLIGLITTLFLRPGLRFFRLTCRQPPGIL